MNKEELDYVRNVDRKVKNDPVNSPKHYLNDAKIEAIDAIKAALTRDEFRAGCKFVALQYVWRARLKGKDEDILKAIWYLRMMVGDDPREGG